GSIGRRADSRARGVRRRIPKSGNSPPDRTCLRPAESARQEIKGATVALRETRRILLDGNITDVQRHGDELVAGDGRSIGIQEAVHLAPAVPSKIICVHLNYSSRVEEMMVSLPP